MEVRLRNLRQETQKFNQDWWTEHNREFKQGRESFIKNILETKYPNEPDKSTLSADEMSQFYRLDYAILHAQNNQCLHSKILSLGLCAEKYVVIGKKKDFQVESGLFRDLFWSRSGPFMAICTKMHKLHQIA